jgi:hypothetical protein
MFQSKICSSFSCKLKDLTKIYYFSDGAASEYKNRKNFINVYYNKDDSGMEAKWHLFAMSHEKMHVMGLGEQFKC